MKLKITLLLFFSLLFSTEKILTAAMEDEIPEHNSKQEVEYTPMQDETPIIDAIRDEESIEAIKKMISNGNVNEKDENGDTPLIWACRLERKDGKEENIVEELLSHNADISSRNNNSQSVFFLTNNETIKNLLIYEMFSIIKRSNMPDKKIDQFIQLIHNIQNSLKTRKRKAPSSEQEQNNRMVKKMLQLIAKNSA